MSTMNIGKYVYDAEDIQKLLGVGRTSIYGILEDVYKNQGPFRVIKIGKMHRIPKEPFDKWLRGEWLMEVDRWTKM